MLFVFICGKQTQTIRYLRFPHPTPGRSCGINPFLRRAFFVFSWTSNTFLPAETPIYKRGFIHLVSSLIYKDHMFEKSNILLGLLLLFAAAEGLAPEFTWTRWIVSKPSCAVLKLSHNDFDAIERSLYHLPWVLNRLWSFSFPLWSAFNSVRGNFS